MKIYCANMNQEVVIGIMKTIEDDVQLLNDIIKKLSLDVEVNI